MKKPSMIEKLQVSDIIIGTVVGEAVLGEVEEKIKKRDERKMLKLLKNEQRFKR